MPKNWAGTNEPARSRHVRGGRHYAKTVMERLVW
jgi:hypothetical protein